MDSRQDLGKKLLIESVLNAYECVRAVQRVALAAAGAGRAGRKVNKDQLSRHLTSPAAGVFRGISALL